MKVLYNEQAEEMKMFHPDYRNHSQSYPLGNLVMSFLDLDRTNVLQILADGFNIEEVNSEEQYEKNRSLAMDSFSSLVDLHPYFNDYKKEIGKVFSKVSKDPEKDEEDKYGYNMFLRFSLFGENGSISISPDNPDDSNQDFDIDLSSYYLKEEIDENFSIEGRSYSPNSDSDIMRRLRDRIIDDFLCAHESLWEAFKFVFLGKGKQNSLDSFQRFFIYQNSDEFLQKSGFPIRTTKHLVVADEPEKYIFDSTGNSIDYLSSIANENIPYIIEVADGKSASLGMYELYILSTKSARVNSCENCGEYFFVLTNHETKYCDRIYLDTGKTCRQVGPILKIKKKRETDPIAKAYAKAYNRFRGKMNNQTITPDMFEKWKNWANELRENAKSNKISFEEYAEKLDKENDDSILSNLSQ